MNIINSGFDIIEQKYDDMIPDMFRHIELCGRNCYKSEDKITDTSYQTFVDNLMKSEHGAMLEHGTVYLTIPLGTPIHDIQYMWKMDIVRFFQSNKYSIVNKDVINDTIDVEIKGFGMKTQASATFYYITTNWRVIYEHEDFEIIKYMGHWKHITETLKNSVLQWICTPTEKHALRHTVAFTYHLAAARDVNRHRVQSIAEESTRYCNYTKEKFSEGEEPGLNIIPPERLNIDDINERIEYHKNGEPDLLLSFALDIANGDYKQWTDIDWWLFSNIAAENSYNHLKNDFQWSNQECSLVLPLDTKTCSIHTAFDKDWVHFFNLRALGSTGAPRPSIKKLAIQLMEIFIEKGWISSNDLNQKYYEIYLSKKNEEHN